MISHKGRSTKACWFFSHSTAVTREELTQPLNLSNSLTTAAKHGFSFYDDVRFPGMEPPVETDDCGSIPDKTGDKLNDVQIDKRSSSKDDDGASNSSSEVNGKEDQASGIDDSLNANAEYTKAFPEGHEIISTPVSGLLCGFHAVILSIRATHPHLPCPTLEGLQEVSHSPAFVKHATAFGMTNEDNFSVDQVGAVLFFWGSYHRLNLRLGYVIEGQTPQLLPHLVEGPACIVWIHNDNQGNETTGALGHFSGLRAA
ncbi:hypothetical protein ACLMJK_006565 [Lecanora helva]